MGFKPMVTITGDNEDSGDLVPVWAHDRGDNPRKAAAKALAEGSGVYGGQGVKDQSTLLSQGLGVLGGVIGAYFGGPTGALAGYSAGTKVGSGVVKLGTNQGEEGAKNILLGGMDAASIKGVKKSGEVPGSTTELQRQEGINSIKNSWGRTV